MDRRRFVALLGSALAAPLARAQAPARLPTLGLLYPNPSGGFGVPPQIIARMSQLGWDLGRNLQMENASAEGQEARLPSLAAQLVQKKVDVIWAAGPEAALAAARATTTIPIAFYGVGYPVEQGLVDSLRRPGRNLTGLASIAGSEPQKYMELLKELAPGRTRLSWIQVETVMQAVAGSRIRIDVTSTMAAAAKKLGLTLRVHSVSRPEDFDRAFAEVAASRAQMLAAQFTALTWRERQRIVDFANHHQLPSVYGASDFVEAGGLLSYGANRAALIGQSFTFVDRILRGAKPAELPVELPSKFELAINLTTAKALGLTIPQSLLLRADRVIE